MDREDFLSTVSLCPYAFFEKERWLMPHGQLYISKTGIKLCIWEQREAFTAYLGTEGVSPYGGNRGSLKYEHVNGME